MPNELKQETEDIRARSDPDSILQRASNNAQDIARVRIASRNLMTLFEAGSPVFAYEVSGVIDCAEKVALVSRKGMAVSGLYFAAHEKEMGLKAMGITAAEGMSAVRHIFMQATRAQNILARKPGAYRPRAVSALYGTSVPDWTPLIP